MAPQGGKKKKMSKTLVRKGETEKYYIDQLADSAAGIRQVNPTNDPKWTPEEDTTMTKDIGGHLQQDFSLPGVRQKQRPQPQRPPPRKRTPPPRKQTQRPPPKKQSQRPPPRTQAPPKRPPPKEPPKSQQFVAKAKIISEKYKRGELSKDQYKSMRMKMTSMVNLEIKTIQKKISVLENKFLNNQVSMQKYNATFDALNKELNRLKGLREKIAV
jgi:hypothetical protein